LSFQKNVIIRQVIGRTLLDARKMGCTFELEAAGESWKLAVAGIGDTLAQHIVSLCSDINVFYMEEPANEPLRKWWFYNKNEPQIAYEPSSQVLTLYLDSRVSYTNEKV
jgi:hypothetical protein